MLQKISSAIVITLCLFLIVAIFLEKSFNFGIQTLVVFSVLIILTTIFSHTWRRNKSREKRNKKAEYQEIYNDNFDWLKKRWDRLQMEKDSGFLRTVDRWYFDRATGEQISQIKQINLNLDIANLTQGQISDILGLFKPADQNDIELLKNRNISTNDMNQTMARDFMANMLNDLVETRRGTANIMEHMIIRHLTDDFVNFARFFDSKIANSNLSPEYIPKDNSYRIRYEQAAQFGMALNGTEIPLREKLKTLDLDRLSTLAGGQKFSSKASAIKILMEMPDIADQLDSLAPIEDWYQLKKVKLDVNYIESKWLELNGDNC